MRARLGLLLLALLPPALACSDASTASSLEIEPLEDGTAVSASWQYKSSSVDVSVALVTTRTSDGCASFARLVVDEAASGADIYRKELRCEELELTSKGDLVLMGAPTEHDWSREPIEVDTASERIHLGPWQAGTDTPSYRFTLLSRPCGGCACPELFRDADGERLTLPFGRFCE